MKKKFEKPQIEITAMLSESIINISSLTSETSQTGYKVLNITTDTFSEQSF